MESKKNTRLTVEVPSEWLKELKMVAIKYNVTIKKIVNTLILEKLTLERSREIGKV